MCVELLEEKAGQADLPAARDVSDGEKDPLAWGWFRHRACGSCCAPAPRSLLASPGGMPVPWVHTKVQGWAARSAPLGEGTAGLLGLGKVPTPEHPSSEISHCVTAQCWDVLEVAGCGADLAMERDDFI